MTPPVPDGPDTELAAVIPCRNVNEPDGDRCTGRAFFKPGAVCGRCDTCNAQHSPADRRADREELAAAEGWFRENPKAVDALALVDNAAPYQRHAATIVRAYLARPAAGRDLTAQDGQPPADEDERAVVEMEHRDRRDRAVRSVAARLRAVRGAYDAEADAIAVRHVLRTESDPPVWQSVRQLSEAIVDYSIRPPFAAAPANDTAAPDRTTVTDQRREYRVYVESPGGNVYDDRFPDLPEAREQIDEWRDRGWFGARIESAVFTTSRTPWEPVRGSQTEAES